MSKFSLLKLSCIKFSRTHNYAFCVNHENLIENFDVYGIRIFYGYIQSITMGTFYLRYYITH